MAATLEPWSTGQATIRTLLTSRQLEHVPGDPAYTEDLLIRCERKLESATTIADDDPESAYGAAVAVLPAVIALAGVLVP